jgi:hypothetical protein
VMKTQYPYFSHDHPYLINLTNPTVHENSI